MKTYTWTPPLYEKGLVRAVKFYPDQRRGTNVKPREVCTIIEINTKYDDSGRAQHFYLVRYNEKKTYAISYRNPSGDMPQMVMVAEGRIVKKPVATLRMGTV